MSLFDKMFWLKKIEFVDESQLENYKFSYLSGLIMQIHYKVLTTYIHSNILETLIAHVRVK